MTKVETSTKYINAPHLVDHVSVREFKSRIVAWLYSLIPAAKPCDYCTVSRVMIK